METECLPSTDQHVLVKPSTAIGFPTHNRCEQLIWTHPEAVGSTHYNASSSTSYRQMIPQSLQCPPLPSQLYCPIGDPKNVQDELSACAVTEPPSYYFSDPSDSPPIFWERAPSICAPSCWGGLTHRDTPIYDLQSFYPGGVTRQVDLEKGTTYESLDETGGNDWGHCNFDTQSSGSDRFQDDADTDRVRDRHRDKRAHQAMRSAVKVRGKASTLSTPHTSCKHFACPDRSDDREWSVCGQKFARIEHLRRHIKTVHGDRSIPCRVPGCSKSFSRLDNLYDHYCTHIDVGNPGRNRRLSLEELEEILGSQDRAIFRILRKRISRPRRPSRPLRQKQ